MNAAHLHLITNHIPILGMASGLFVLIWGLFTKNKNTIVAASVLIALCAIGGIIANKSGEEAEETVEHIAGISRSAIHEHEEAAELAIPFIVISGITAVAGLWLNRRNHKWASLINLVLLVAVFISLVLSSRAGWMGGKIRHQTEINAAPESHNHHEPELKD
jgi:uncharacterized membrane protein